MAPQPNLRTQLFKAARNGDPRLLAELIHRGAPPDCRDSKGFTPLGLVCFLGRAEAARVLLANGADPELGLTWDLDNPAVEDTHSDFYLEAAQEMKNAGGLALKAGPLNFTPLMLAALGDAPQLVPVLVEGRANLEATAPFGWTALSLATIGATPRMLRALLRHGASTLAADCMGQQALDQGYIRRDPEMLDLILEYGPPPGSARLADPRFQCQALLHPQSRLARLYQDLGHDAPGPSPVTLREALSLAIENDNCEAVRRLAQLGADVLAEGPRGETPLLQAACSGRPDMVRCLLDLGADPDDLKVHPLPPLLAAVLWGNLADLEALLLAGTPVNQTAPDGRTALQLAVGQGNLAAVRLLLNQGADPNLFAGPCCQFKVAASEAIAFDLPMDLMELPIAANRIVWDPHPTHRQRRRLPLAEAVAKHDLKLIQLLLDAGANPNLGSDPLVGDAVLAAVELGNLEILELLLNHGAKPDPGAVTQRICIRDETIPLLVRLGADLQATDEAGRTLLSGPSCVFCYDIPALVQAGLGPNAADQHGLTALDHILMDYLFECFLGLRHQYQAPKVQVRRYQP